MKKIKVIKFGGSSLETVSDRKKICSIVKKEKERGYSNLLTVSAMGRLGDPYATDTLLSYLFNKDVYPKETALLASCGEIISSIVLSSFLRNNGIKSLALTGPQAGIKTSNNYLNAKILSIYTKKINHLINNNIVPIVAGFQGKSENGNITLLGRGGSDVTAACLAHNVHAAQLDIYTDVPGIMTADPNIVNSARTIKHLGYEHALMIAENGGKVIHPEAIKWAKKNNIPINIKSFADKTGTLIADNKEIKIQKNKFTCLATNTLGKNHTKITIIGNELRKKQIIESYLLNQNLQVYSYSAHLNNLELIVPPQNVNKLVKLLHQILFENIEPD